MMGLRWLGGACAALLCAGCASTYYTEIGGEAAEGEMQIRGLGLASVDIEARQGAIHIRAGEDDTILLSARVGPGVRRAARDGECSTRGPVPITAERKGATLRVRLDASVHQGCVEEWAVSVPTRFRVRAALEAGEVSIDNVSGGTVARVSTGNVSVHVPGGSVTAEAQVGVVQVVSARRQYGLVDLSAGVGSVEFAVGGMSVEHQQPAGPGDWLRLHGSGDEEIRAKVNVGDVRVAIGPRP